FPGELDADGEAQIKAHMGIEEEADVRIAYRIISHGHGRSETVLLTVGLPEAQANAACAMFPVGVPAPISIELSGLASITAFLQGPGRDTTENALGIIECGVRTTFLAFFHKGELALFRELDFGIYRLLDSIQQSLGVDRETAQDIIIDGSFDISQLIRDVSEPFIKQLVISKHFVERREDCHIEKVFAPSAISQDWLKEVKTALAVDVESWNPFDGLNVLPNVLSDRYAGKESRFAAAVGAGLGVLEETET
ncbi:pilus assembly protein PilM, partial [Verrucomicrobiota bacterium]